MHMNLLVSISSYTLLTVVGKYRVVDLSKLQPPAHMQHKIGKNLMHILPQKKDIFCPLHGPGPHLTPFNV